MSRSHDRLANISRPQWDLLKRAIALAEMNGTPLRLPPLLIRGLAHALDFPNPEATLRGLRNLGCLRMDQVDNEYVIVDEQIPARFQRLAGLPLDPLPEKGLENLLGHWRFGETSLSNVHLYVVPNHDKTRSRQTPTKPIPEVPTPPAPPKPEPPDTGGLTPLEVRDLQCLCDHAFVEDMLGDELRARLSLDVYARHWPSYKKLSGIRSRHAKDGDIHHFYHGDASYALRWHVSKLCRGKIAKRRFVPSLSREEALTLIRSRGLEPKAKA